MKKLKLSFEDFECDEVLTREQLKKVLGGGGCGVKVDGVWHPSGLGASATESWVGSKATNYDPNNWGLFRKRCCLHWRYLVRTCNKLVL